MQQNLATFYSGLGQKTLFLERQNVVFTNRDRMIDERYYLAKIISIDWVFFTDAALGIFCNYIII